MSSKRYTDEFKTEAVKQVLERGHPVAQVAHRLGVNKHSLYEWVQRTQRLGTEAPTDAETTRRESAEVRRLKAELKRVTEERDILKRPRRTLPRGKGEVRIHE